jgi:hypothetical protein
MKSNKHSAPTRLVRSKPTTKLNEDVDQMGNSSVDTEIIRDSGHARGAKRSVPTEKMDESKISSASDFREEKILDSGSVGGGNQSSNVKTDETSRRDTVGQKTRVFRGTPTGSNSVAPSPSNQDNVVEESVSQVTGWVVIVKGPGRGNSLNLGYGQQRIGRDQSSHIRLDFGDMEISREKHAGIVYDPKGRKFYLQPGDGVNLTYLNDSPALAPTELETDSFIQMGETTLRFVALCGPDFDWQEED